MRAKLTAVLMVVLSAWQSQAQISSVTFKTTRNVGFF